MGRRDLTEAEHTAVLAVGCGQCGAHPRQACIGPAEGYHLLRFDRAVSRAEIERHLARAGVWCGRPDHVWALHGMDGVVCERCISHHAHVAAVLAEAQGRDTAVEYALRLSDQRIIQGPGWTCEGDVIAATHGQTDRVHGDLVVRVGTGPWQTVRSGRDADTLARVRTLHGSLHWCVDRSDGDDEPRDLVLFEPGTDWWPCPTLVVLDRDTGSST